MQASVVSANNWLKANQSEAGTWGAPDYYFPHYAAAAAYALYLAEGNSTPVPQCDRVAWKRIQNYSAPAWARAIFPAFRYMPCQEWDLMRISASRT